MGRDLIGPKKKSRSGGAPEAGRKDGRGKGKSPSRSQDTKDGNQIKKFFVALGALPVAVAGDCRRMVGKVVCVIDGDSVTVFDEGRGEQIRLWGIDCPEKTQDFGTKAKHITSILVFARVAQVEPVTAGRSASMTRREQRGGDCGLCQMPYRHESFGDGEDGVSVIAPLLPQAPHDWAASRVVDSVRRSPSRVKSRLDPISYAGLMVDPETERRKRAWAFVWGFLPT